MGSLCMRFDDQERAIERARQFKTRKVVVIQSSVGNTAPRFYIEDDDANFLRTGEVIVWRSPSKRAKRGRK